MLLFHQLSFRFLAKNKQCSNHFWKNFCKCILWHRSHRQKIFLPSLYYLFELVTYYSGVANIRTISTLLVFNEILLVLIKKFSIHIFWIITISTSATVHKNSESSEHLKKRASTCLILIYLTSYGYIQYYDCDSVTTFWQVCYTQPSLSVNPHQVWTDINTLVLCFNNFVPITFNSMQ